MWSTLCPSAGSPVPCSRSKLAVCVYDGFIYMLGGRNGNIPIKDFWKYSLSEHVWTELQSKGDSPSNLQDHTVVGYKGKLYVFGGEFGFASTGETPLWCYNIASNCWKKASRGATTPRPQSCRGHTAAIYENCMYIYGGYRDLKGSISDLWAFDLETEVWQLCKPKGNCEVPTGRHDHSVVLFDGAMWVYGGMTDLQAKGDFWRWDFTCRQWNRVRCKGGPAELHGHSACKILNSMVVFGGEKSGQLQQDVWRYYFSFENWEKVVVNGTKPSPRSRHLSVVVPTLLLLLPSQNYSAPAQTTNVVEHGSKPLIGSTVPSWEVKRLPKSETTLNCSAKFTSNKVELVTTKKPTITSSFSQNNFKFLRDRISNTTTLFRPQAFNAATYVALSNSSDSVQSGQEETNHSDRATLKPLLLDSTNNKRMYGGKTGMLSVPNFLKIHQIEKRGLMDDLSDSSSIDVMSTGTQNTPKKLCQGPETLVKLRKCENLDSLENIPDIKDFISPDVSEKKFQEDEKSLRLIDFEDSADAAVSGSASLVFPTGTQHDNEEVKKGFASSGNGFTSPEGEFRGINKVQTCNSGASCSLPATPMYPQQFPKSLSYIDRSLVSVSEDKHRIYANCLSKTSPMTPDGNHRWPNTLEMKTFQQRLTDFDEGISEDMFPSPDERDEIEDMNDSDDDEMEIDQRDRINDDKQVLSPQVNNQSRHFTMLVLGGREKGINGCGKRPIIVWKMDFWK